MRKLQILLALFLLSISGRSQSVSSVALPPSACQGDTIQMSFNITSPYVVGNSFYVEMSDSSGSFIPSNIVSGFNPINSVSNGNLIDVFIPDLIFQGAYKFRLRSSQNGVETTISNIVIASNPQASLTAVDSTYFQLAPNGPLLFCDGD